MSQLDDIVSSQMILYQEIRTAFSQYNECHEVSTIDGIEAGLLLLDSKYSKYQSNHAKLLESADQEILDNKYFKDDQFSLDNVEEIYISQYGFFLEKKRLLKLHSSSNQSASFTESKTFLQEQSQSFNAMEGSMSQNSSQNNSQGRKPNISNSSQSNNSQNNFKVENTVNSSNVRTNINSESSKSKSLKYFLCHKNQILASCDDFRDKTAKEQFELSNAESLCLNCLGKHPFIQCRCLKARHICHLQHHSLLQKVFAQVNPVLQSKPNLLSNGQGAASIAPSLVSHSVTLSKSVKQNAFVLMGTAIVEDNSSNGQVSQVRALPDPCAEAAYASESVRQRLKLQRSSFNFNVKAVADLFVNVRIITRLSVRSCINSNYIYNTEAFIVANVSSYVPKCSSFNSSCQQLFGTKLAHFHTLILDVGHRKGLSGEPLAQKSAIGWTFTCCTSGFHNVNSQLSTRHLSKNCHIRILSYRQSSKSQELKSITVPEKSKVTFVKRHNLNSVFFNYSLSAIKTNVVSVECLNLNRLSFVYFLSVINPLVHEFFPVFSFQNACVFWLFEFMV